MFAQCTYTIAHKICLDKFPLSAVSEGCYLHLHMSAVPKPSLKRLLKQAITVEQLPALVTRSLGSLFMNRNPRSLARDEEKGLLPRVKDIRGLLPIGKRIFCATAAFLATKRLSASQPRSTSRPSAVRKPWPDDFVRQISTTERRKHKMTLEEKRGKAETLACRARDLGFTETVFLLRDRYRKGRYSPKVKSGSCFPFIAPAIWSRSTSCSI